MAEIDTGLGRRAFLTRLAAALGAFLSAAVGVPLVGAVVAPGLRRDQSQKVVLGAVGEFAPGQPRLVTVSITKIDGYLHTSAPRAVWVYRAPDDQLVVYNARCTHLGCLLTFQPSAQTFFCPCHGGVFGLRDGQVLDGPPPRPLDRLSHQVTDGQLFVEYRDFLAGVPDQVPL